MNRIRWWARCAREAGIQLAVMASLEWSVRRRGLPSACSRAGIVLRMDEAGTGPTAVLPQQFRATVRAVAIVTAVWPFRDTCLRRCLLLGHRLRELRPVLRIGVRPERGGMLAHSWLEIDGRSLDPTAGQFGALRRVGGEIG